MSFSEDQLEAIRRIVRAEILEASATGARVPPFSPAVAHDCHEGTTVVGRYAAARDLFADEIEGGSTNTQRVDTLTVPACRCGAYGATKCLGHCL